MTDAIDDRQSVEAFRGTRSESAFVDLYRRHSPRLYAIAWRLTGGHRMDAEDVVQETWIRAAAAIDGFRGESTLAGWLRGIAVNVWRERWRTRLREEPLAPDPAGAAPPLEGGRLDLERAIARLPAGYRAVVVLHDIEGLTHEEIADRLEISAGTSKSQLFHARRTLKTWLEDYRGHR